MSKSRYFVYETSAGPASENFATLAEAVVMACSPTAGAVIVQGARAEPSGPAPSDVPMAVCKTAGRWTLTGDGEEEPGTWKLVKGGLAQIEASSRVGSMAGDAA